jgi:hypothetical protein
MLGIDFFFQRFLRDSGHVCFVFYNDRVSLSIFEKAFQLVVWICPWPAPNCYP